MVMDILDVKELTVGIVKSSVNMEHPSGMVTRVSGDLIV